MLKIRDCTAPDDTVMTIGRFRGETYMNIPTTYADWASDEERANGDNMHPELKRFVIWRRNQKAKENHDRPQGQAPPEGYLDVEDNAMIPPPPVSETGASASAWDMVDRLSAASSTPPRTSTRPTRRPLEEDAGTKRMERDVEPHMLEEIRALEERLACLRDAAGVEPRR